MNDTSSIALLRWPKNKAQLRCLSITEWQAWYLSQDSRYMCFLGQDKEFKSFVFWNYTIKVRALRLYYRIKRNLGL